MDETQPDAPAPAPAATAPSAVPPHVRLQQLLAIPDKQRSDEQWDELNELEIKLASVNRQGAPQQGQGAQRQGGAPSQRQDHRGGGGGGGGGGRNNQNNPRNNQGKKFHRRPPRPV